MAGGRLSLLWAALAPASCPSQVSLWGPLDLWPALLRACLPGRGPCRPAPRAWLLGRRGCPGGGPDGRWLGLLPGVVEGAGGSRPRSPAAQGPAWTGTQCPFHPVPGALGGASPGPAGARGGRAQTRQRGSSWWATCSGGQGPPRAAGKGQWATRQERPGPCGDMCDWGTVLQWAWPRPPGRCPRPDCAPSPSAGRAQSRCRCLWLCSCHQLLLSP